MKAIYVKTLEEAKQLWKEVPVGRAKNFTNKQINNWHILYRTEDSRRPKWVGQCKCGNYGRLRGGDFSQQCTECQGKASQKDYTGMKFHKLTVLNERENRNGKTYLKCLCDCGNETWVSNGNLTSGEVKSCGCMHSKTIRKYGENFIGMKFNSLTVIEKGECSNHGLLWKCKCDCGKECYATAYQLESGAKQSCNCLPFEQWKNNKTSKTEDLTGKIFYDLTVIDFSGSKDGSRYWTCRCKCGNLKDVSTRDLIRGSVKSCGCRKYLQINPGDKFGKLTVIKKSNNLSPTGGFLWECDCDCGTKNHIVIGSRLIDGSIKSCGCGRNISYDEENINTLLNNNNLFFIRQYNIEELNKKYPTHGRPREFDFYINNQYIIEYDGSQHFKYTGSGWDTEEHFERTRKSDLIKNKYCFDNNIPIIRIPYDADYTIDDLKLETTRFLLTPENEKEYYESRK